MFNKRILCALTVAALVFCMTACMQIPAVSTDADSAVSANGASNVMSNRYAQVDDTQSPSKLEGMTLDGYEKIAENDLLALYLRQESASLRVVNKESGYIWGALRQDKPDDLNKTWSSFGNSIVSIKYYDETGNIKQIGAGHEDNSVTYDIAHNGVVCNVTFNEAEISLSVQVSLEEDHIRFSLDDATITESGEFKLAQVFFAPFLGSTVGDEIGGYMFVPDGSGALIRFRKPTKYLAGYSSRVYGSDYAIDNLFVVGDLNANRTNDFLKDSESVSMPVFGISHGYNSNALFGYLDSGAQYAAIMAEPAGIITDYNYCTAYFIYRQVYMQPTGRDGAGIQMVQENRNTVNPSLSIYFLADEDANYNGMASVYRNILIDKGLLTDKTAADASLAVDFLAADIQKGFLFNSTATLTGISDIENAAAYFKANGVEKVSFQLLGWQPGGLNGYHKLDTHRTSELGDLDQLAQLRGKLKEVDYDLSMYLAPLTVKEGQIRNQNDYAITLSQNIIEIFRDNEKVFLGDTLFLKTSDALEVLGAQVDALRDAGLGNVTVDNVGGMLYGEYLRDNEVSRTQTMENVTAGLMALQTDGLALFDPNEYCFGVTDVYRDTPLVSSRYTFETDSVPFVQLVLSGYMTMYAPYANQSFYTDEDVLKCIEYNAYPSFLLTGADSSALKDTPSEEYFSTCFDDWKQTAVSIYDRIDSVLRSVQGQTMISHKTLLPGVYCITYSGGSVYVNYTQQEVTVGTVCVPARGAVYVAA